jgi:hypothetical protein
MFVRLTIIYFLKSLSLILWDAEKQDYASAEEAMRRTN